MSLSRTSISRTISSLRPSPAPRLSPKRCLQIQSQCLQNPSIAPARKATKPQSLHLTSSPIYHLPWKYNQPHRSLSSDSLSPSFTVSETRILPYPTPELYALIADIDAYSSFLPYCLSSRITSRSSSSSSSSSSSTKNSTPTQEWPQTADLRVGFGGYEETFTSRIYCSPNTILEALCGDAEPSLTESQLQQSPSSTPHHSSSSSDNDQQNPLFTYLRTTWRLKSFPFKPPPAGSKEPQAEPAGEGARARTEVSLNIEVKFRNVVYATLSQAAAPKVAGVIVGAFEERARKVLGRGHEGGEGSVDKKPLVR